MSVSSACGRYYSDDAVWTSARSNWSALHLRRYNHSRQSAEFETSPFSDHLLVLVTRGATVMSRHKDGAWQSSAHVTGHISMVEYGDFCRMCWDGVVDHETLQLHLPPQYISMAISELRDEGRFRSRARVLSAPDPLTAQVMLSLADAANAGVPNLYAESAAHLLARHVLTHVPTTTCPKKNDAVRLHLVEEYMRENLGENITLDSLVKVAGCSTFQLLRRCKEAWNETPFQRLTRLRMNHACSLLRGGALSVSNIAFDCGYSNPSHFAIAFKRTIGVSPSEYRRR
jgi:AraC family transcriptional regulator